MSMRLRVTLTLLGLALVAVPLVPLPVEEVGPFKTTRLHPSRNHAYTIALDALGIRCTSDEDGLSPLELREDGRPLPRPHAAPTTVHRLGKGAYLHEESRLVFSTTDNSDPRTNGRAYTLLVPRTLLDLIPRKIRPAWLGPALFAGGSLLVLGCWLPLVPPRLLVLGLVGGAFLAATLASASHLHGFHLTRSIPLPVERLGNATEYGAVDCELERHSGPFLVLPDQPGVALCLSYRGQPLRQVADLAAVQAAPDSTFCDADQFLLLGVRADLRDLELGTPLELRHPVVVTWEACGLLALVALLLAWRAAALRRFLAAPTWGGFAAGTLQTAALAGVVLLLINAVGFLIPLRSPSLANPSQFAPGDVARTWDEVRHQLARAPEEAVPAYAERLTVLVADSLAHAWQPSRRAELRLQVPLWENYSLWWLGEWDELFRRYEYRDPRRALERGVGLCSQAATVLAALLGEAGIDARLVSLDAHVVVTAEVAPGTWWVLDPDHGVVLPWSLAEVEANPARLTPAYEPRLRQAHPTPREARHLERNLKLLCATYATGGHVIHPPGPLADAPAARWERWAYQIKYGLPVVLLAPWLVALLVRPGQKKPEPEPKQMPLRRAA